MKSCSQEESPWNPKNPSLLDEIIVTNHQSQQPSSSATFPTTFRDWLDYYRPKYDKNEENSVKPEGEVEKIEEKEKEEEVPAKIIKCEYCNAEFSKRNNFSRHLNRHTNSKHYKCKLCERKFLRSDQMKNHLMCHVRRGTGFDCPVSGCEMRVLEHSELRGHLDKDHKISSETPADCKTCLKTFFKADSLLIHFQTGHGSLYETSSTTAVNIKIEEDPPLNPIQSSQGNTLAPDDEIQLLESWPNRYQCDVCNLDYSSIGNLHRHQRSHTSESFECSYCDKKFPRKDQMNKHINIHMKQENSPNEQKRKIRFTCPVDTCQMPFNRHSELESHVDEFHGISSDLPVECKACLKSFPSAGCLLKHFRAEHEDSNEMLPQFDLKNIKTEIDDLDLPEDNPEEKPGIWSLVRAMEMGEQEEENQNRSNGKTNQCDVCHKFYSTLGNLRRHRKRHLEGKIGDSMEPSTSDPKRIKPEYPNPDEVSSPTSPPELFVLDSEAISEVTSPETRKSILPKIDATIPPPPSPDAPLMECVQCGIFFNDVTMFVGHRLLHSPDHPFKCGICGCQLKDKFEFTLHFVFYNHSS